MPVIREGGHNIDPNMPVIGKKRARPGPGQVAPLALDPHRFAVGSQQAFGIPIPLGQLKRQPYDPASANRRSIDVGYIASLLDQTANETPWIKQSEAKRQEIMKSLQRAVQMPDASQWSVSGGGGSEFNRLVSAIAGKESGGNYGAVNRHSGALGKYQIMPGNVGPWSREILGRSVTTSEFLRSPQLQESIARGKLQQYYSQYGAAGAATAWYAGPGAVARKMQSTKSQGSYPSINSYVKSILGML